MHHWCTMSVSNNLKEMQSFLSLPSAAEKERSFSLLKIVHQLKQQKEETAGEFFVFSFPLKRKKISLDCVKQGRSRCGVVKDLAYGDIYALMATAEAVYLDAQSSTTLFQHWHKEGRQFGDKRCPGY